MELLSPAFQNKQPLPQKYSCQGEDISPPLLIDDLPKECVSIALTMDDPDAPNGTWDHWVVWNIPPQEIFAEGKLPDEASLGVNSWGKNEYGGPCPPSGTHRYFLKVYALSDTLELGPNTTKEQLEKAIKPILLEKAVLMGVYTRI